MGLFDGLMGNATQKIQPISQEKFKNPDSNGTGRVSVQIST